jgi:hypothetical protein
MLLSILYRFVRCLLGLNAVLARQDLSKDAELLVSRQGNDPPRRPSGRPPTAVAIKKSRDSQGSRESHLQGELIRLGHRIAASTVWQIGPYSIL